MKISSLLNEAEKTNSGTAMAVPIDKDLIYRARNKYPGYSAEQSMILLLADEMKNQEQTDTTQNRLIDTQKRENERLRGAITDLGQELQDFEQQSQETDREVERLKQLSGKLSQGGAETQIKAKVSADDLEKMQKDLEALKAKPGIDSEKVKELEVQIKQMANSPSFDNNELNRVQQVLNALNSKQAVSDDLYQKAFNQLQQTQEKLDAKEERFKNYISTTGREVRTSSKEIKTGAEEMKKYADIVQGYKSQLDTSSKEIKKYADIVQGYKSQIDNFDKEVNKLDKEKDIIIQLRAGVQQDAQTISDMKDEISAKLDLINDVTRKFTGKPDQAQNDPTMSVRPGSGPNADILGTLAKGSGDEKNITKGAEQMLGRKLAEGNSRPIRPLQKYDNPKYDEWINKHLPALVQIFKNKYWRELEKTDRQYSDEQIHYIVEKYTPMLYNLADEDTPLTEKQVNNWLVVVKSKLWEQPVENQLELFTESLDKTYVRMLDKIIGLPYI
jgi:type VII secretion effector (TIGR04197 family)